MTRPLRINIENGLYHVTSRGNERKSIFTSKDDRNSFLEILAKVVDRYGWICHAYCLMENHYHIVIETPRGNLSQGMRQLNGVYTQYFNIKYRRNGHLFQGRFKAVLVEKEAHLLELTRYVVLNPVKAKICNKAGEYEWSSYNSMIGVVKKPVFLFTDWILSQFGGNRKTATRKYEGFVNEGRVEKIWDKLAGQIYLGSREFIEKMVNNTAEIEEVPRIQQKPFRPMLSELVVRKNGLLVAHREHGYTMKEIANHLNVHYATVSRKLKKLELSKEMYECKT